MKRRGPTTFGKCLAIHMAGTDRRDHRLPSTVLAKLGHCTIGAMLGAVVVAIVIGWMMQ